MTIITVPFALGNARIEIPTGYAQAQLGSTKADKYYTYDAGLSSLTDVSSRVPSNGDGDYQFTPSSGYGGVIIANESSDYAMGVYGVTPSKGGSVNYFTLWNFISTTDVSKWGAVYGVGTIPAGNSCYLSWVMTGTLEQVKGYMGTVYSYQQSGVVPKSVAQSACPYNGLGSSI